MEENETWLRKVNSLCEKICFSLQNASHFEEGHDRLYMNGVHFVSYQKSQLLNNNSTSLKTSPVPERHPKRVCHHFASCVPMTKSTPSQLEPIRIYTQPNSLIPIREEYATSSAIVYTTCRRCTSCLGNVCIKAVVEISTAFARTHHYHAYLHDNARALNRSPAYPPCIHEN